jgi:capsular polysaccharide biosynthesis protein
VNLVAFSPGKCGRKKLSIGCRLAAVKINADDVFVVCVSQQVSELTADLAEEHSTAILATERLEAETAQRMKLDKDFTELEVQFFVIHLSNSFNLRHFI